MGADSACQSTANKPVGYSAYRAFISVNVNDEIQDMPTTYSVPTTIPIKGTNDVTIADNWADLLDGSIDNQLRNADIGRSTGTSWWSGSLSNGAVSSNTCNGWTSNSIYGPPDGEVGANFDTGSTWLEQGSVSCANGFHLVCIAFDP